jgi:hypothetical protein
MWNGVRWSRTNRVWGKARVNGEGNGYMGRKRNKRAKRQNEEGGAAGCGTGGWL